MGSGASKSTSVRKHSTDESRDSKTETMSPLSPKICRLPDKPLQTLHSPQETLPQDNRDTWKMRGNWSHEILQSLSQIQQENKANMSRTIRYSRHSKSKEVYLPSRPAHDNSAEHVPRLDFSRLSQRAEHSSVNYCTAATSRSHCNPRGAISHKLETPHSIVATARFAFPKSTAPKVTESSFGTLAASPMKLSGSSYQSNEMRITSNVGKNFRNRNYNQDPRHREYRQPAVTTRVEKGNVELKHFQKGFTCTRPSLRRSENLPAATSRTSKRETPCKKVSLQASADAKQFRFAFYSTPTKKMQKTSFRTPGPQKRIPQPVSFPGSELFSSFNRSNRRKDRSHEYASHKLTGPSESPLVSETAAHRSLHSTEGKHTAHDSDDDYDMKAILSETYTTANTAQSPDHKSYQPSSITNETLSTSGMKTVAILQSQLTPSPALYSQDHRRIRSEVSADKSYPPSTEPATIENASNSELTARPALFCVVCGWKHTRDSARFCCLCGTPRELLFG